MSISFPNLFNGTTTVPSTTMAPNDAFGSALNQLAAQVQQFQAQVAATGASAYNNASFISTFNSVVNTVGQYQASVTNAGAGGAPYQPALNAIDAQLNQIKTTLTTPATTTTATSPYGYNPYGSVYGTDTYSAGLSTLSQQIMQLQSQVASAGPSAISNQTILGNYRALATQVNTYINSVSSSGQAAANPNLVAQLNDMTVQLNQIQSTLQQDAAMPTQNPYGNYSGIPGTTPGYPGYPGTPSSGPVGQPFGAYGRHGDRDGDRWGRSGVQQPGFQQGGWQQQWQQGGMQPGGFQHHGGMQGRWRR